MRYIATNQLTSGMVLGQDVFDAGGTLLLAKDTKLTQENIRYITYLGTAGVYIDDEISRNIQVDPVVQEEVRQQAVSLIQDVFSNTEDDDRMEPEERLIRLIAESVVNDVLVHEDVIYNMMDVKTYDDYTYFHSMNVGVLSAVIGAKLELDEEQLQDLVMAAFLHDIGKVFVRPELLNLSRKLTPDEKQEMRQHAEVGYRYLQREFKFKEEVNRAVLEHHEWYNGKGYPKKLSGEEISMNARILHIADVYDEMVSKRPGREAYLPSDVMEYIMARSGMEFDPDLVKITSSQLALYPLGCEVTLSDRRKAIVVENHAGFMQRPTVRLIESGEEIDLQKDRSAYNITIVQANM